MPCVVLICVCFAFVTKTIYKKNIASCCFFLKTPQYNHKTLSKKKRMPKLR